MLKFDNIRIEVIAGETDSPEISSSTDWAPLSRLFLKAERESSFRNAVSLRTGKWAMSKNTIIILICHLKRFRCYLRNQNKLY
jgi:hypothetical protein